MRRQVLSAPSFRHLRTSVKPPAPPHLPGLLQAPRAGSAAEHEAGDSRRQPVGWGGRLPPPGSAPVRSLRSTGEGSGRRSPARPSRLTGTPRSSAADRTGGTRHGRFLTGSRAPLPATPRPGRFRRVQSSSSRDCVAATLRESLMLPQAEPPAAPAPPGPASRRGSLTVPGPASQDAPGAHRAMPIGWRTRHSASAPPLRLTRCRPRRVRNYAYWLARPSLR